MSLFSKSQVKTAVQGRSPQKFSTQHVTTADFMQMNCAFIRELVPGQHFEIDVDTFSRLTPVAVPTLGDCEIKHHAFFVPFRTIMPSWHDFITDTPHQESNGSGYGIVPFAHRLNICMLSSEICANSELVSETQSSTCDISRITGSDPSAYTTTYFNFTPLGRQFYKILTQLGYQYEPDQTLQGQQVTDSFVSAMPLLAFVRIYLDWYYPSAYVGDVEYSHLMSILRRDPSAGFTLSSLDLTYIVHSIAHVCYDNDYFTSAFDNPAGPNSGLFSSFTLDDVSLSSLPATSKSQVVNSYGGTPTIVKSNGNTTATNVSQYILDSLHALSDYMKRHQLVGSRALDRFLARWGVSLGTEKTDRSYHLGTYNTPVQFGAVMSNAGTSDSELGSYAGQGYSANFNNHGHFVVDTNDDFGFIMVLTSVIPKYGYVQGINKHINHVHKLDFFTPEFDALGTQPIANSELYCDTFAGFNTALQKTSFIYRNSEIFGFTPRYAEYKIALDQLTGDFRLPRMSQVGDTSPSWHLFRLFDRNYLPASHSKSFMMPQYTGDAEQYDRIFQLADNTADHFVIIHRFNISSSFPGKSLYETYDFDNERGKQLLIESGGVKMN